MTRALLNMRHFVHLVNHFSGRCSIYSDTVATLDASGQPNDSFGLLRGHQDIPCVKSVLPGQANESEIRRFGFTASIEEQQVLLQGYWPDITDGMRCLVDGQVFRISGVDHESQAAVTRLRLERVR